MNHISFIGVFAFCFLSCFYFDEVGSYMGVKCPILDAVVRGDLEEVKRLVKENPSLVSTKGRYLLRFPLHVATEKGYLKIIKVLLEAGEDVNQKNVMGWTPLHEAALWNRVEVMKLLVENGADIEARGDDGWSALHFAAWYDHPKIMEYLIEKGADIEAMNSRNNRPLHYAAKMGNVEVATVLIDHGAKLDEQGWDDWTPLHFAAEYGCLNFFFLLLQKGASPNLNDSLGLTPVDHLLKNDCSCVKPPADE